MENLKKADDSRVLGFLGFHSLIFDIRILAIAKKEKGLKLVEQALAPEPKNSCNLQASKQASTREAAVAVAVAGGFMVVFFL